MLGLGQPCRMPDTDSARGDLYVLCVDVFLILKMFFSNFKC
jgi:hypothetical protein